MKDLSKEEFFHVGTNNIKRELWEDEQMLIDVPGYAKSIGGFWTSMMNPYSVCDWLEFEQGQDCYSNKYDSHIITDSCIVKLKDDAKVLTIFSREDFDNARKNGLTTHLDKPMEHFNYYETVYFDEILDYDRIAENYEAILINPNTHESLYPHSVITLYITNPDAILYYKPATVDLDNMKITEVGEKKTINALDNNYYKAFSIIESYFPNITCDSYEEYIEKLCEIRKKIESMVCRDENLKRYFKKDIDTYRALRTIVSNIVAKKYKEKKKELTLK